MRATILDDKVIAHEKMDFVSPTSMELVAGEEIDLGRSVKKRGQEWVQVTRSDGRRGYIPSDIGVQPLQTNGALGQKNMLYGAIWCISGIVFTAVTYSAASSGDIYIVVWGAIFFGGLQFLQGLGQYLRGI